MNKTLGKYIVFEGGEGVGKTTQIRLLKKLLEKANLDCITTKEPGGTDFANKYIRPILLKKSDDFTLTGFDELMLFSLNRSMLIRELILPSINKGINVISDRSYYTTLCYQGFSRNGNFDFVYNVSMEAIKGTIPDIVIGLYLDDIQLGLQRSAQTASTQQEGRFEDENIQFHTTALKALNWLHDEAQNPDSKYTLPKMSMLNAKGSIEEVHMKIRQTLVDNNILPSSILDIKFKELA